MELATLTDIELLALLIAGEADGEPLTGIVAVACVPVERLRRGRWGGNLRQVMLQRWQFSTFNDDHWRRFTDRMATYAIVARLAIDGRLRSPFPDATHYHAVAVSPYWITAQKMRHLGQVGAHVFYCED